MVGRIRQDEMMSVWEERVKGRKNKYRQRGDERSRRRKNMD